METRKKIVEEIKEGFAMIGKPVIEVTHTRKGETVITTNHPDVWSFITPEGNVFVSIGENPFNIGEIKFPNQKGGNS